jgi:hypothetical protein
MAENKRQRPKLTYQDRDDLFETFADSLGPWSYDGNTLRMEFLVTRLDPPNGDEPQTGRQYPVCRVALTAKGAMDLLNQCRQLTAALEKAGAIKKASGEGVPIKVN